MMTTTTMEQIVKLRSNMDYKVSHLTVVTVLAFAVLVLSVVWHHDAYRIGFLEGQAKVYQDMAQMPAEDGNCYAKPGKKHK